MKSAVRSKSTSDLASAKFVFDDYFPKRLSSSKSFCVNSSTCREPPGNPDDYYPNCDATVWLRSCEHEVIEPLNGTCTGTIPEWLRGSLLRNGPGSLKVGQYRFDHLFDSSALLHRFEIADGKVTYQRRFVQTDVYKRNQAAKRIVFTEFGTRAVPDPCQSIFHRVAAAFRPTSAALSDNSMISIYPFGDEFYTFTESPVMHRIDPKTLETLNKVNVSEHVGIVNHTSHPHVMKDGTVYNQGMSIASTGPAYNIVRFSPIRTSAGEKEDDEVEGEQLSMFDQATIVATVPSRWILNPSYMHTFGITDNYFIIIEQPLALDLLTMLVCRIKSDPFSAALKWHENESTLIHVVSRRTGTIEKTFIAEAFFFLHIINQFEATNDGDNSVVLDVCCYRDSKMLECMYVDAMKNMQKNPNYSQLFRGRPLRFVLPMDSPATQVPQGDDSLADDETNLNPEKRTRVKEGTFVADDENGNARGGLERTATAHRLPNGDIFVTPELLCDLGCETPRMNTDSCLGKPYRYFYAISTDVDLENPGLIIKVDTLTKTKKIWTEKNVYPSEPIFVPDPNGKKEDDGIILSVLIWGQGREEEVGLIILDAATFREIARATFVTPGPVPKCLHGWFHLEK